MSIPTEPFNLKLDEATRQDHTGGSTKAHEPLFEPLLKAIQIQRSDFCFKHVHMVTKVSDLRRLYQSSTGDGMFYKGIFQIDVEVVGGIVFLCRSVQGRDIGFGRGFQQRCVVKALSDKARLAAYHRICQYGLGDMRLVVQIKSDAAIRESDDSVPSIDDSEEPSAFPDSALLVHKAGRSECPEKIVEIQSRDFSNKYTDDNLPRLYLSGAKNLLVGRHSNGYFEPQHIQLQDMSSQIEDWPNEHQRQLRVFASFLKGIQSAILEAHDSTGCQDFALVGKNNKIKLFKRTGGAKLVPDSFEREWLAETQ